MKGFDLLSLNTAPRFFSPTKMILRYSSEFLKALEPLLLALKSRPKLARHDIQSRRDNHGFVEKFIDSFIETPNVEETVHLVETEDGSQIGVHSFLRQEDAKSPTAAVLHCHGRGMIMGSVAACSKAFGCGECRG